MKRSIKIMLVFLSFSFIAQAQTAIKSRGDKAYKEKDYVTAIKEYKITSESAELSEKQLLNLANSYYKIRDFKNAAEKYIKYVSNKGDLSLTQYNQYLQSLKLSNYNETVITDAINTQLDKLPQPVIKRYNYIKEEPQREKPFSRTITSYNLENLDINSPSSDFGVTLFPNSTLMFSSSKENVVFNKIYKKINQPFINIYETKLINNAIDTLTTKKYVEESMKHSSSPFYDSLYNRLFYNQSESKNNKLKFNGYKNNFRIVYGFVNDKMEIEDAYYYPRETNGYSYGHPYFDKETKRLYFVSDMPGGYGGTDIYYVEMNTEGITSEPVNLGEKVNSFGNEMFPSIVDNQLYFSSDLFIGKGGLDVYTSKINNKDFDYPLLLEGPINSSADDFTYLITEANKTEKKGYFSSNRSGGKGSDDIYSFLEYKTIKKVQVSGYVRQEGKEDVFIPNATIQISNTEGKLVKSILTDNSGMYNVLLPIDQDYVFKVDKKGYVATSGKILLAEIDNTDPISKDYYMIKELVEDKYGNLKINLEPIYFNFDDASITPRAEKQLQFAINYLKKYPAGKFKLEAHTDSRGRESYNLKLSTRRAKSVYQYLISKGISAERIVSVKGYGETRLINDCKNGVKCTDEQHEQNRRTDFVIVEPKK
ncbi:OmpA family protein [Polaribacter sp. MSW13]|uniref:OmpA family protein n=1 Tax=Polaribacter marinus TaxID=2916838 RepID=A0A9X2AK25_9FLAO|nr:OmpA family protein [Polaribacter marinus]MCI2229003.1 OmpA family protein [Polaribacter marinus]